MNTSEAKREKVKVYTEPPKPWWQKDHPWLPWIAVFICLVVLAITAWFAIPALKNGPRSDPEPAPMVAKPAK